MIKMADVTTETGKKWLQDFKGSEQKMRERILAIEDEIRQMVQTEDVVVHGHDHAQHHEHGEQE
jgi:hypothetical protein